MGVAAGDIDRDGNPDLYVTNYWNQPADLYALQDDGVFTNRIAIWGAHEATRKTVGWGAQAADLNRDGWLDVVVMNGHVINQAFKKIPYQMRPQLFEGSPEGLKIDSRGVLSPFWQRKTLGRSLAILDWNRDGRPDLVAGHLDAPVSLVENRTVINSNAWLRLQLVGTTSERDATGAEVTVKTNYGSWSSWVFGGDGFQCTNESILDIGLGESNAIDNIQVKWPSGQTQVFDGVPLNSECLLVEGLDSVVPRQL